MSKKHASYVKDAYDFVYKIRDLRVWPNTWLFSINLSSLYTNIDTVLGLQAVQQAFQKYSDHNRPEKEIIQLLELSVSRNDFELNYKYYLQTHRTSMGKKFAPAYAKYMSLWEEMIFHKCKLLTFK